MYPIQQYIDYTLLRPGTRSSEIDQLCEVAIEQSYQAVCVPPCYVQQASRLTAGSQVKTCTVIGFPHGMHLTTTKVQATKVLIKAGAEELDMMINLAWLKDQRWDRIASELEEFGTTCAESGVTSKVIIESGMLDFEEIKRVCELCETAPVDFVKTSSGFNGTGAELEKVVWMRQVLSPEMRIKASGGIRDFATAKAFIEAGADRIGTSTLIVEPKPEAEDQND